MNSLPAGLWQSSASVSYTRLLLRQLPPRAERSDSDLDWDCEWSPTQEDRRMNRIATWAGIGALTLSLAGCAGMDYRAQGTVVGAGIGGAAGAALTDDVGGAVGGAVIGGLIGHEIGRDRGARYDYEGRRYYRGGYYDRYGYWHPY